MEWKCGLLTARLASNGSDLAISTELDEFRVGADTLGPSDAYMCHWAKSSLLQEIAGAKPLPGPTQPLCHLETPPDVSFYISYQPTITFEHENALQIVVWKRVAILSCMGDKLSVAETGLFRENKVNNLRRHAISSYGFD